jgi:flagellar protein FlgJ
VNVPASASTDLTALARLRGAAAKSAPGVVREAAGQFAALLLQSMLKSMRAVSFGGGIFDSQQSNMYRDMLDQQLALQMSRGHGLGLTDMIARQLGGEGDAPSRSAGLSARIEHPQMLAQSATEFVKQLLPHARDAARQLGVSAKAILAQAALETGWGQRLPNRGDGSTSWNLFGIKAGGGWKGDSVSVPTIEYAGDVARRAQARFRAYGSPAASFADYVSLLGDPRYAGALDRGEDVGAFGRALQDAGYATDPDYARKLEALATGEQMRAALEAAGER